jgi:hypothetical protein
MRITRLMPSPEGVGAGQVANFKLPINRRYHRLGLVFSGITLAQMQIRIYINERVFQSFSGTVRDIINQFDGYTAAGVSGILYIPFNRSRMKTASGEDETAVNTGSLNKDTGKVITSFRMEITQDPAAAAPAFTLYSEESEQLPGGAGTLLYVEQTSRNIGGAGLFDFADLKYGGIDSIALNRLTLIPSANALTDFRIERDTEVIFERTDTVNRSLQALFDCRFPVAGSYMLDFTEHGRSGDVIGLVGVKDFRLRTTATGACVLSIYQENLGQLI